MGKKKKKKRVRKNIPRHKPSHIGQKNQSQPKSNLTKLRLKKESKTYTPQTVIKNQENSNSKHILTTEKSNKKDEIQNKRKKEVKENQKQKVTLKSRKSKWLIVFFASFLISTIGSVWGYMFLNESIPTNFTSKLTGIGDIRLSYGERQSEKISPLCGCYDTKLMEHWRGITFTGRDIEIKRNGDLPVTGYLIFPPFPTNTTTSPSIFKMNVSSYLIELDENEKFNPHYLLSNKFPSNYNLIKKVEESEEGFVQILSEGNLRIALLGDKPLGTWIPMENSNITISYQLGKSLNDSTTAIIKEKYYESTLEELNRAREIDGYYPEGDMFIPFYKNKLAMPLGDFLGPNVVLWIEHETTSIIASSQFIQGPLIKPLGRKNISAIVINPPFSVRIVAIPFDRDAIIRRTEDAPKRAENDYSYLGSEERFDSGEVSLIINNVDNQAQEFEKIYQSIKQKEIIESDFKTYYSSEIAGGKMEFRYPPIPPNSGFNIFGKINKLKINSTLGNLLLGSRLYNIEAPSEFELRNIKNFEVKNGIMEIPIQLKYVENPSNIQLRATSEVIVNNESISRRLDNNKTAYEYSILVFTVLSAIITLLSLIATIISLKNNDKSV